MGKEIEIQGYEAFALNLLLEQGVKEEDLLLGFSIMPRIMYEHKGKCIVIILTFLYTLKTKLWK